MATARRRRTPLVRGIRGPEAPAGWLFVAPAIGIMVIFLLLPILMALWVSFTSWNGQGSPFTSSVEMAGGRNYSRLFAEDGLTRLDFMTSVRNTAYYVAIVVPVQTSLALFLALVVNQRVLRGRSFFRTAYFFPSVTSSVAISVVFLFLFTNSGAVNRFAGLVRHPRSTVVLRPSRRTPYSARGVRGRPGRPAGRIGEPRRARTVVVGLAVRAERGHVRHHHVGRLDHLGHVHADVPLRPPEPAARARRGGHCGRRATGGSCCAG
jgi:hypothetical protein